MISHIQPITKVIIEYYFLPLNDFDFLICEIVNTIQCDIECPSVIGIGEIFSHNMRIQLFCFRTFISRINTDCFTIEVIFIVRTV